MFHIFEVLKSVKFLGEKYRKLSFIPALHSLQTGEKHFLSKENLRKMNIRCKLSEKFILKQIPINAFITFSLIYGYYCFEAYKRQDYNYTINSLIVWFVIVSMCAWNAASMQGIAYSLLYLSQYYLHLRFRQIAQRLSYLIDGNITDVNSMGLSLLLKLHNKITETTLNLNKFFNEIVAINYFAATVAINLLLYIAFFGYGNIYFRIGNGLLALNKMSIIFLATYTSANLSKEVFYALIYILLYLFYHKL